MALNLPVTGTGAGAMPETGAPILQPSTSTSLPQPDVATTRPQAAGGPPTRTNNLQTPGNRPPQGATLPPRRASTPTPTPSSAPWAPHAAIPCGMPQGLAPHQGGEHDPMQQWAKQMESLIKTMEENHAKFIEITNKSAEGVKNAVSPR